MYASINLAISGSHNVLSPSHYPNQCWFIVNWSLGNKFLRNLNQNTIFIQHKANLRDLIAATSLVFLLKIGLKLLIFGTVWPRNLMEDLEKNNRAPLLYCDKLCASVQAIGEFNLELQSGNTKFGSKSAILVLCDLEIWRITLKNNRAPVLCNFKLRASFHSHPWIKNGVTVQKYPI